MNDNDNETPPKLIHIDSEWMDKIVRVKKNSQGVKSDNIRRRIADGLSVRETLEIWITQGCQYNGKKLFRDHKQPRQNAWKHLLWEFERGNLGYS